MKWSRSSSFELPVPMSSGVHGQLGDLERLDFGGAATPTGDERPPLVNAERAPPD